MSEVLLVIKVREEEIKYENKNLVKKLIKVSKRPNNKSIGKKPVSQNVDSN
jgi:hypothetical protein